jgi:hypothetical protein
MQKVRVPISSFQFGEVSDSLRMRTDSPVYAQSAQSLENMVVMAEGSVKKRYGLKHIHDYDIAYDANNPAQSHLFKFIFDENEEYVISVEHQKVRCFRLLSDGSISLVSTLTADVDSAALPFDQDYLQEYTYAQYGDVMFISHPLFMPRMITRTSLTSFEISTYAFDSRADNVVVYQPYSRFQATGVFIDPEATTGSCKVQIYNKSGTASLDGIDTGTNDSTYRYFFDLNGPLASGGTVTFEVGTQISITSISNQSSNVFIITGTDHAGNFETEQLNGPNNSTVYSKRFYKTITSIESSFALSASDITVGVSDKRSVSYFDITGSKTGGAYLDSKHVGVVLRYAEAEMSIVTVQSPDVATVEIVDELKRRLTVLNPFRTIDGSSTVEVTMLDHGFSGGESITIEEASAVGGINTGNLNGARTVNEIIDENTFTFSAGGSASSAEDGGGYVKIVSHAPTTEWSEQSYSAARGYPAAVTFHENRLCFGGTLAEPDTIWMSQIGEFFNFDEGEAADSEAITLTAATGDVNEIRYMVSNRDLQVFTASGELYIPTYLNQAITPTNAQIRKQTPYGSSFVQPVSIDGATVFVQQNGKVAREYLYSDAEDAYTSTAISTIASHLIDDPKCLAVVHSGFGLPDSYAALTLGNGDMALFSSNRAERRAAWTRVTTDGRFCSVVAIEDRLFVNVWYNDQLHLCEFTDNIGVDNYITDQVMNPEAIVPTFSGGDFEGKTVDVLTPYSPTANWYVSTTTGANWEERDITFQNGDSTRIARFLKGSADTINGGQYLKYKPPFTLKKGVTYTIQFTLFKPSQLSLIGYDYADVRVVIPFAYTGDWITESDHDFDGSTVFTNTFTIEQDTTQYIQFEASHSSSSVYATGIDDVSITSAVNEPFDLASVNSGFAAGDVVSLFEGKTYIGDETLDSNGKMDISQVYGKTITIGKKFTAKIESNQIDASMGSGPSTGSVRGLANIVVDFKDTRSAKVNSRKFILEENFSGKKEFRVLGYSRTPTVTIEQDDPLPMQVNGIIAELVT